MAAIDHLVFAAADLAAGTAHIADSTGTEAVPGGPHPGVGTRNALLSLDDETYFEIIAVDPDQPDPGRPRPFGIDQMVGGDGGAGATGAAGGVGPRLAGYAIHPSPGETIDEVAERMRSAGFDPGPVTAMSRVRPDGVELSWRLTLSGGVPDPPGGPLDGVLPFIIDWGDTASPATSSPPMGRLSALRIAHPDAGVRAALEALALDRIEVVEGDRSLVARIELTDGEEVALS